MRESWTDGKYYIEILRNFTQIICYTGFIPERKVI